MLGGRIWVESRVDFRDRVNLVTAALALVIGAANYSFTRGDFTFEGIAIGSVVCVVTYHALRLLQRRGRTDPTGTSPSDLPVADVRRDGR